MVHVGLSVARPLKNPCPAVDEHPMSAVRLRRCLRRDVRDDRGVTMIELMVAMSVFSVVAVGIAYGLNAALLTGRGDRMRVQAANLAGREMEIVRNEFTATDAGPGNLGAVSQVVNPHPLPGGTAGQPLTIDGNPFTVTRTVEWLPAGTGASPCDGGTQVTYPSLAVNVRVTWPQMGGIKPVVSNTVLTPPKSTVSSSLGFVAVKVLGAAGTGLADIPVNLTGPSSQTRLTAADGCAVFALSTPGAYNAVLNVSGMISFDGNPSISRPATVTAGQMVQVPFSYDRAVSVAVRQTAPDGYPVPATLPALTIFNTGIQPLGRKTFASTGTTTTLSGLWPFVDGYSVWAGCCDMSDPSASGGSRPVPVVVEPGGSGSVDAPLAAVTVTVVDDEDPVPLPVVGATVTATASDTTGCLSGQTSYPLGVTDAVGQVRAALPGGVWDLAVNGGATTTPTPELVAGAEPAEVEVVVP